MKKVLTIAGLAVAVSVYSQSVAAAADGPVENAALPATGSSDLVQASPASPALTPIGGIVFVAGGKIAVDNTVASPVPVYLTSTPDSAESASTTFWQGVGVGFAWGGIAWIFRLVRQTAKQNPEI